MLQPGTMLRNYSGGTLSGKIRRRFGIVGTGVSGQAAIALLRALDVPESDVLTFDTKDPQAQFNDPVLFMQQGIDALVISPGVPLRSPWIQRAIKQGIELTSELELAYAQLTQEILITITGSLGKSTTTALIGHALEADDESIFVGGNLGTPLARYVSERLQGTRKKAKYVVLELSSYQLELFENLKSDYSIFTFFSPNHLERYHSLEQYYETKWTLFAKTKAATFANLRGGDLKDFIEKKKAAVIWCERNDERMKKYSVVSSAMVGSHNLDNLSLALGLFEKLGLTQICLPVALEFTGLPHRLQRIGSYNGVTFINDSKATALDSVIEACHSVLPEVPTAATLWVLLGGRDKNLPWEELSVLEKQKNIRFTFFGECAEKAQTKSKLPGSLFASLAPALENVVAQATRNDIVLLSPGGTSQDEFKNFEERGHFFASWVRKHLSNS